jgi:hypothetical protein
MLALDICRLQNVQKKWNPDDFIRAGAIHEWKQYPLPDTPEMNAAIAEAEAQRRPRGNGRSRTIRM